MNPFIEQYDFELPETNFHKNVVDFRLSSPGNYLKIIHLNIRSIQKNFDEFNLFLNLFDFRYDIIVLTETYVIGDLDIVQLKGYNAIYNNGNINKNDGVIVFIRNTIDFSSKIVSFGNNKLIEVSFKNLDENVILTACYRSPNSCIATFVNDLNVYFQSGVKNTDSHIFIGDVNIDTLANSSDAEEYKNILSANGYLPYINACTRKQSRTCLDHIVIKSKTYDQNTINSYVFPFEITDHWPVAVFIKCEKNLNVKEQAVKIKKYTDYNKLKLDLQNETWSTVYQAQSIDEMVDNFVNLLIYYTNINTKIVKSKFKQEKIRKPWITKGLLKSINEKNRIYLQSMDQPNNEDLNSRYKLYKNKLNRLIAKSKQEYTKKVLFTKETSSMQVWKHVNSLCSKTTTENKIKQIKFGNHTLTDKREISNAFNNHYSEIGKEYAEKIKPPDNYEETSHPIGSTLYLFPVDESEIIKAIKQLKNKTSPGFDKIRSELLKEVQSYIIAPLQYIINKCFHTGCYPKCLKLGIITPLYKGKGNKQDINNFRPITLISNISKIFEKIIKTRIDSFFKKHAVLSSYQYGFRDGRSTEDAILSLANEVYESLDKKNHLYASLWTYRKLSTQSVIRNYWKNVSPVV